MDLPSLRRAVTMTPAIENLGTWWDETSYTFSVYGDFDPSRSYTLTLAASAADPYGSTLAAPFSLSFSTLDLSPLSGFMRYSDVLSLDASGKPVLQVQARNADLAGLRPVSTLAAAVLPADARRRLHRRKRSAR